MGGSCRRGGDFGPAAGRGVGTDPQGRHACRTSRSSIRSGRLPTSCATTATWSTTRCWRSTTSSQVKPQMLEGWKVSDDKLTYTFTLRDGLKFHDGQPVTAEDCVASLNRWAPQGRDGPEADVLHQGAEGRRRQDLHPDAEGALRPGAGVARQALARSCRSSCPSASPRRRATCRSARPSARARSSSARTCGGRASSTVYDKFKDYKPRAEPPSGLSGGKVVHVDRVEWLNITDPQTVDQRAGQRRDRHDRPAGDRAAVAARKATRTSRSSISTRWAPRSTSASTRCTSRSTIRRSARPCSMR